MRRQSQHGDAQWCRLTMVVCVAHVAQSLTHTHPKTQSPLPVHYYPHICVVCAHTCARTSARHGGGWHGWWLNVALATSFVGLADAQHRSCGSLFGGFDCFKITHFARSTEKRRGRGRIWSALFCSAVHRELCMKCAYNNTSRTQRT